MLEILKELHQDLKLLRRDIAAEKVDSIAKKSLRQQAEDIGTKWFSEISEGLNNSSRIEADVVGLYSQNFARLIKLSAPNNLKTSYLDTLTKLLRGFRSDLIIPIQQQPRVGNNASLLVKMLEYLPNPDENAYLKEATDCAKHRFYRAAVVLGWCAAIDRIHNVTEKIGFEKFNVKSSWMASQTSGRFKRFSSPQNVSSVSELRQVFDTIVLWVLEGMQVIDSNEHMRLRSCFDLRCQCSHPGDAPVTEFNLLSYFSDLNEIVFKNPKFKV